MTQGIAGIRNRLKLRQLGLLVAIDEEGTLHGAARRLGMTQPAATRLLRELEDMLESPLFQRSRHGMAATELGGLLIRHAALILGGVDHAFSEALAMRAGDSGHLRVGQFASAPPSLLAKAIVHLKRASPQLNVRVTEGPQELMIHAVRDGELHLALTRAPSKESADYLAFEVLLYERFSIVCGSRSRRRRLRPQEGIASLIHEPWILPLPSTPVRASLDLQFWAQCGRVPADVVEYAAHTGASLISLLRESDYVALIPSRVAAEYQRQRLVRVLMPEVPGLVGPIGILTRQGEALPSHGQRLLDALKLQQALH